MRNCILLLLIITLNSCHSNNDIDGTWVGPYRGNPFQNQATVSEPYVISFNNGNFTAKGLHFDNDSGKYFYSATKFEFNNEGTMTFASKINLDSIAFEGTKEDPYPIIFRKIPDSLKSKNFNEIKLSGKKFIFDGIKNSDTLYFKNDSILSYSYENLGTFYKRLYFQGLDIIFISDGLSPPIIIKEKMGNKIKTYSYPKKLKSVDLIEI